MRLEAVGWREGCQFVVGGDFFPAFFFPALLQLCSVCWCFQVALCVLILHTLAQIWMFKWSSSLFCCVLRYLGGVFCGSNVTRVCFGAVVLEEDAMELGDPCPWAPEWSVLIPPPPLHHHHPSAPFSAQWATTCDLDHVGVRPEAPQHQLSLNILVCVCVYSCLCLWKDGAKYRERPGQVKWYCP